MAGTRVLPKAAASDTAAPVMPAKITRGHHVAVREAAAQVAHQRVGEGHQPPGDAGAVHDLAGQDEERHGHEGEEVQPLEIALGRHGQEVLAAHLDQAGHPGQPQDVADGQPHEHQPEEKDAHDGHAITSSAFFAVSGALSGKSRTMVTINWTTVRADETGTEANGTSMVMPKMLACWFLPSAVMPML